MNMFFLLIYGYISLVLYELYNCTVRTAILLSFLKKMFPLLSIFFLKNLLPLLLALISPHQRKIDLTLGS